jgi:hypothetical protein
VLIEFDRQRPGNLRSTGRTKPRVNTWVIRTPNGNEYGKDLLHQHYSGPHGR